MIAVIVLIVIVVVIVAVLAGMYNSLVKRRNQVDNSWSQIDVQLKRRHDLIPNLVEAVKDYMSLRAGDAHQRHPGARRSHRRRQAGSQAVAEAENALTGTLKTLFAVAENYPDLKANQNVMQLQEELTSTENKIAFARQFYNDSVLTYNNKIQMFPSNLIAGMFNFTTRQFFEVPEAEKAVPTVDLR